jgi:aconitate hydratase
VPVVIKVGDDVSTDEILMAGAQALPYRSDIAKLADFAFVRIDEGYPERARETGPHAVIGGRNYGQGSSREHAAIAPRHLGLRLVLARGYARIHWQNLVNFGILPLEFADEADYERVEQGDRLRIGGVRAALEKGTEVEVRNVTKDETYRARHRLSRRQRDLVAAGGQIPALRERTHR